MFCSIFKLHLPGTNHESVMLDGWECYFFQVDDENDRNKLVCWAHKPHVSMQRPFDYACLVYLHSNCKHNVVHVLYLDIFVFYVTGAHVHVR